MYTTSSTAVVWSWCTPENEGSASTSADELVYVLSAKHAVGLDEDDEEYYEYDVFMDGREDHPADP